jgi:hypothetical protein
LHSSEGMEPDRSSVAGHVNNEEDNRSQNVQTTNDVEAGIDEEMERERIEDEQQDLESPILEVEETVEQFDSELDLEEDDELEYDPNEADMARILEKGRYNAQQSESIVSGTNFMLVNPEESRDIEVYSGHAGTMQIWKEEESLVVGYEIDDNLNFDCPEVELDQTETDDLELLTRLNLSEGSSGVVIETPRSELRETIYELSNIDEALRTEGQFSGESILYMADNKIDGELDMEPTTDEFDKNRRFYELKDRIEGDGTYSGL